MWKSFFIAAAAGLAVAIIVVLAFFVLTFGGGNMGDFQKQCTQLNGVVVESTDGIICRYNTDEVIEYE